MKWTDRLRKATQLLIILISPDLTEISIVVSLQHLVVERTSVAKLPREELEDRYLRLYEENLNLKQEVNSQEEKLKK